MLERLHVIVLPVFETPVAPEVEQNDPGCTVFSLGLGVVFFTVVFFGVIFFTEWLVGANAGVDTLVVVGVSDVSVGVGILVVVETLFVGTDGGVVVPQAASRDTSTKLAAL